MRVFHFGTFRLPVCIKRRIKFDITPPSDCENKSDEGLKRKEKKNMKRGNALNKLEGG